MPSVHYPLIITEISLACKFFRGTGCKLWLYCTKGLEEKKFLKKEHRVSENNHGDMSNMYKLYPRPYEDTDTKCTETYIQSCEQKKDFPHHRKIPYENNGVNKTTV